MHRDPEIYGSNADQFVPERYLDDNGTLSEPLLHTKDEGHLTFGFGRRYDCKNSFHVIELKLSQDLCWPALC